MDYDEVYSQLSCPLAFIVKIYTSRIVGDNCSRFEFILNELEKNKVKIDFYTLKYYIIL